MNLRDTGIPLQAETFLHSIARSVFLISCRVQIVEQGDLKFGGGRFGYSGITWDVNIRQENDHRFSALFRTRPSIFHSPWWLLLGLHRSSSRGAPAKCHRSSFPLPAPGLCCNDLPGPPTWIIPREGQGGKKAGRKAWAGHLLLVPVWGWETECLSASGAKKWFSK